MDRKGLQTPTNQSGSSELSQGSGEPRQTLSQPIDFIQTPVISVDIQLPTSTRFEISSDSACLVQNQFQGLQITEQFKNMTTELFKMERIRQSGEILQTPSNQLGLSGTSGHPRKGRLAHSQPTHFIQPLQAPVTSGEIERPSSQMSPPLSGALKQAASWIPGSRLGISSDSSRSVQYQFQVLQMTDKFNDMTTTGRKSVPLGRCSLISTRRGFAQIRGMKIIDLKYRHGTRLDTIPEVITEGSQNSVSGITPEQLHRRSVRERRISEVRYRYGKLLPQSSLKNNISAREDLFEIDSWSSRREDFGRQIPTAQQSFYPGLSELPLGNRENRRTKFQSLYYTIPFLAPVTSVRSPSQVSPLLSSTWPQETATLVHRPRLGMIRDSSCLRQNPPQEMQHVSEQFNDMITDND